MTTSCADTQNNGPLKFLGATVLSFNSSLGLGGQESSLSVEVIEDLDAGDAFLPLTGGVEVGAPVYFTAGDFTFGGVLQSWNGKQSTAGKTFSVKIADPRQLLENCVVITDTYAGPPMRGPNYFNVFNFWEGNTYAGTCGTYGLAGHHNDQGMPYQSIIEALVQMNPQICSPTGYNFYIDFSSFPNGIPGYYRIPGPSVTILQLLSDVCDVLGFDFYVNLINDVITIGLIDLKIPPQNFDYILSSYEGNATELSYGQELRNEITKTVLMGEKVHYLSQIKEFYPYFGQDLRYGQEIPVIPHAYDPAGFWIAKNTADLQLTLSNNTIGAGPHTFHELDIRAAMGGFKGWLLKVTAGAIDNPANESLNPIDSHDGTLNYLIRFYYGAALLMNPNALNDYLNRQRQQKAFADMINNPNLFKVRGSKPEFIEDLETIHQWLAGLGNTYYGKQYFCPLNEGVCYYRNGETGELVFSSEPTKEGGWVDPGFPVLGLNDPGLEFFREQDGRVGSFILYRSDGEFGETAQDLYMPDIGNIR